MEELGTKLDSKSSLDIIRGLNGHEFKEALTILSYEELKTFQEGYSLFDEIINLKERIFDKKKFNDNKDFNTNEEYYDKQQAFTEYFFSSDGININIEGFEKIFKEGFKEIFPYSFEKFSIDLGKIVEKFKSLLLKKGGKDIWKFCCAYNGPYYRNALEEKIIK